MNITQKLDALVIHFGRFLPDKLYLSLRYRVQMGYWNDWSNPQTFTEKIQWLKIHGRKPEYTTMVDKHLVKEYVSNIVGAEYIIPTIKVWDSPTQINWENLPKQFVIKTTHGGGNVGVFICNDKTSIDKAQITNGLKQSLKKSIYRRYREWPYLHVKPRIIAEKLLRSDDGTELSDYKFFCFNGEPKYCQVIRDRRTKETIDFYDMNWQLMPFVGLNPACSHATSILPKPDKLNEMIEICRKLSRNIPFVRIDLYFVNKKVYFGEITFYPGSGFGRFEPAEWNYKLGELIHIQ